MIKLELNITLQCNLACPNCNRLCHIYRDRTEHMSIQQIEKFVEQAKNGGGVSKLKVLGGEPLMHPQFVDIYKILTNAAKDGVIRHIKIETNKTRPIPQLERFNFVSWSGRVQRKKKHLPTLWSPKDLGYTIPPMPNCPQITKCGYSLDKYGYLPCSMAVMICRIFNLRHLYRYEFPTKPWGLDELCPNCIFGMPHEWRSKFSGKDIFHHTEEERSPTKSYKEKLDGFDYNEFYKTQKEF